METMPELKPQVEQNREWTSPFFYIEFFCCLWFSIGINFTLNKIILELIVRFISSPSKSKFMKTFLNILDFVAVAPFFINLLW